jgi:hypothetical protein
MICDKNEKEKMKPVSNCFSDNKFKEIVLHKWGSDPRPVRTIYVDNDSYGFLPKNGQLFIKEDKSFRLNDKIDITSVSVDPTEADFSIAILPNNSGRIIGKQGWSTQEYCKRFNSLNYIFNINDKNIQNYVFSHIESYFATYNDCIRIHFITPEKGSFILTAPDGGEWGKFPYQNYNLQKKEIENPFVVKKTGSGFHGKMTVGDLLYVKEKEDLLVLYLTQFEVSNIGKIELKLTKLSESRIYGTE